MNHFTKNSAELMKLYAEQLNALARVMESQDEEKASSTDEVIIYSTGLHIGRISACIEGIKSCIELFGTTHLPTNQTSSHGQEINPTS